MDLDSLVISLSKLGIPRIGIGPRSPRSINPQLQADIDQFFAEYPHLKSDPDYVKFLETYSAAVIQEPNQELFIAIYGFSDFSVNLLYPDESLVNEEQFLRFAEISYGSSYPEPIDIGINLAWDITGERRLGVYRRVINDYDSDDWKTIPYLWYCDSFLELLRRIVDKQGQIID